jgi:hypothetical protein
VDHRLAQSGQQNSRLGRVLLLLLSELWVGSAYAISYAFPDRRIFRGDQEFEALSEDLRLIRVQIEKHQIASDRKLDVPLDMVTPPGQPRTIRTFQYDKSNPLRAHIGRFGLSDRNSGNVGSD